MFYEVIYTRCGYGMDLLKKGQPVNGEGYKVYNASQELLEEGAVDIPLLVNAAQSKQSYREPLFMDDAYLYYVPDKGNTFLTSFHPVPYDPEAQGDYSKRPGNFVNHILAGDFSEMYPYELFHDREIWTAQEREESYYYSQKPERGCIGRDISSPPGQYTIDEIKRFIADERQEVLKQAVAFLISQYEQSPDKRKFLVIRDEKSSAIELWIAAIELAFSPRMAAGLSFATRQDKFSTNNIYTVNQAGVYQQQINLQDPKQFLRYKAMIVGVVDSDKANVSLARSLQSSPFVLLDGKQKKALFSENIKDSYFDLITRFDDRHLYFCREFLQTFEIKNPAAAVLPLYKQYCLLSDEELSLDAYADILKELNRYDICSSTALRGLYNQANKKVEEYIDNHFSSLPTVMEWIKKLAFVLHDDAVNERLVSQVRKVFMQKLYAQDNRHEMASFWNEVKESEFANEAASEVIDLNIIREHEQQMQLLNAENILQIIQVYFDAKNIAHSDDTEAEKILLNYCVEKCFKEENKSVLGQLNKILSSWYKDDSENVWIERMKVNDEGISAYVLDFFLDSEREITISENRLFAFCDKLKKAEYEPGIFYAMERYVENMSMLPDLKHFLEKACSGDYLSLNDMNSIYRMIDGKLETSLKGTKELAQLLQSARKDNAGYIHSAHICAANLIINYRGTADLRKALSEYVKQGFPSIIDEGYIHDLAEAIGKRKFSYREYTYLAQLFLAAPPEYFHVFLETACLSADKKPELWNCALVTACKIKDSSFRAEMCRELRDVLVDTKRNKRGLKNLGDLIENDSVYKFYCIAADEAMQIREARSKSGLKKAFGLFKKG